jgi:hypothetical protein
MLEIISSIQRCYMFVIVYNAFIFNYVIKNHLFLLVYIVFQLILSIYHYTQYLFKHALQLHIYIPFLPLLTLHIL